MGGKVLTAGQLFVDSRHGGNPGLPLQWRADARPARRRGRGAALRLCALRVGGEILVLAGGLLALALGAQPALRLAHLAAVVLVAVEALLVWSARSPNGIRLRELAGGRWSVSCLRGPSGALSNLLRLSRLDFTLAYVGFAVWWRGASCFSLPARQAVAAPAAGPICNYWAASWS